MVDAANSPEVAPALELRMLGPLELWAPGAGRISLPRSKKTRALLAYLAGTGRAHRRERLCALLWDVTDDPRGALRWSLSRLRQLFNEGQQRIEADREQVALRVNGMRIDTQELSAAVREGVADASTAELERLAGLPRGGFLEGLDLPDFLDFNAWCIAERERFRQEHCAVLAELVGRLHEQPTRALGYARQRAQADAFNVAAQTALLRLLLETGKVEEARQRFDNSRRLYREVGASGHSELEQAWHGMLSSVGQPGASAAAALPERVPASLAEEQRSPDLWPFVGRKKELALVESALQATLAGGAPRVVLVTGEPGSGKSRLAERLAARASRAGFELLSGRAYEAESKRPYGPWVDALQIDLQELLSSAGGEDLAGTRDALFEAMARRLEARAEERAGLLLVLDDFHWLDRDSAELLHFLARTYAKGPLFILLLARGGELSDNEAVLRALRGMRRESHVEELEIEPLSRDEVAALVGRDAKVDVEGVFTASAGNPLYAIELARAQSAGVEHTPSTLLQLVRERVEQLPEHAADVLRWGAVLGHAVDVERLEALSALQLDELMAALERLEHSALLRIDATRLQQRYVFSHGVVREAVYDELSHPRRRLMHRRVAQLLEPQTSDAAVATEIAHHAGLAGEALLGVRACIVAAKQSLRVFANGDAEALAKRGLRLAEDLDEAERISSTLNLLHVQYAARAPDREQAAARVRELAEQALDLGLTHAARLGFQMLSFLRWESASLAAAHDNIMQAERVSRLAGPDERTAALAQAAKCLVLLERNLAQAEAFVMEADALTSRAGHSSSAVSFATGMIAAHRGEIDQAVQAFDEARLLSREHGERLAEFCAVEHRVMLEIDRGGHEAALGLSESLADLGQRLRAGAEAPSGRALLAFVRLLCGQAEDDEALVAAIAELREADAKYELSFLLTRWAQHALDSGRARQAQQLASDGLEVARALGRASETALAHAVLLQCAREQGDAASRDQQLAELETLSRRDLSLTARRRVESAMSRAEEDRHEPRA